jgi:adenylate kinase family enzyme
MGDSVNIPFVFFLDCSEDLMIERILKRAKDAGENARNDDTEEVLR